MRAMASNAYRAGAKFHRRAVLLALSLCAFPALAAGQRLPLWKVTGADGHALYLAGSMHALRKDDYPLPAALLDAFRDSDRLVEEIDIAAVSRSRIAKVLEQTGTLPGKQTLADAMGDEWDKAQALARAAGVDLTPYLHFRPWLAAVEIADRLVAQAGYEPDLGMDRYFSHLAGARGMPITGLETFRRQMRLLSDLRPEFQRRFLLETLREAPQATPDLAALHAAWRNGETARLAAIERKDFAGYPRLRKLLLDHRNHDWLPVLEQCLSAAGTCFVVVGVEHMIGPDGLPALLRARGYHVAQMNESPPGAAGS